MDDISSPETDLTAPQAVLGLAHHRAGRMAEAVACYDRCLATDPDHPRLLGLLGQAQMARGVVEDGLANLRRAAQLMPWHDETCLAYANAAAHAGDYDAAAAQYRVILARVPAHLAAALNLAAVLRVSNQWSELRNITAAALTFYPGHPHLLLALAVCDLQDREMDRALSGLDLVLEIAPDLAEAYFFRGTALNIVGRNAEAVDAQLCAIALAPHHAPAHLNLGNALVDLDQPENAAAYCQRAIELDPKLVEAYVSLGHIYTRLRRVDAAMAACRAALALVPGHVQAHWNLGIAALLAGDWALGWRQYEWRKRPELYAEHFRIPQGEEWRGGDLNGRTVTICAEQGLGDAIHLARYFPLLAARGAKLILSCARPLMRLFAGDPNLELVLDRALPLARADLWVDQMSLPGLFGTRIDHVVGAAGYIEADSELVPVWRDRLPQGYKVGLVWGGNPLHSNDRRRSMDVKNVEELLDTVLHVAGVSFVSLQVGRDFPSAWQGRVFDAAPWLDDFAQTAACISCLDLVIAVDTSTAHLAGALGRDVWVMLPFAPDWRWLQGRSDTPWYNSMRLFRQAREGDWRDVTKDISRELQARLRA